MQAVAAQIIQLMALILCLALLLRLVGVVAQGMEAPRGMGFQVDLDRVVGGLGGLQVALEIPHQQAHLKVITGAAEHQMVLPIELEEVVEGQVQ